MNKALKFFSDLYQEKLKEKTKMSHQANDIWNEQQHELKNENELIARLVKAVTVLEQFANAKKTTYGARIIPEYLYQQAKELVTEIETVLKRVGD